MGPLSDSEYETLCAYRYARIQAQLQANGVAGCLINNPVNLRYGLDFAEYALFQSHIPTAYAWIPAQGPAILFGASQRGYRQVGDYRRSEFVTPFDGGLDYRENTKRLARTLLALMGGERRVAIERFGPDLALGLQAMGCSVVDAEPLIERAKMIKSAEEIQCIRHSIWVAEGAMKRMQQALHPGMTEVELLSILHQHNIAQGGDWCDGKMLCSGPRTNPWLQEATQRVIQSGDLVAFDTDMIGPMGYLADISRTWLCDGVPTDEQCHAYQHAWQEIQHNRSLLRPGVDLLSLSQNAYARDPIYREQRYVCAFHGCGLCDEFPKVYYPEDWPTGDYHGVLEPNMVISVESYSGAQGGGHGVKLEDMFLITANGAEQMTRFQYEADLMIEKADV